VVEMGTVIASGCGPLHGRELDAKLRATPRPQDLTPMPDTTPEAQVLPEGRAHAAPSPVIGSRRCPICQKVEPTGRQTVWSAACRRERTRQREKAAREARHREIRALLEAALEKLQEGGS